MNRIASLTDHVPLRRWVACLVAAVLAVTCLSASGGAAVAQPAASQFGGDCAPGSGKADYATDRLMLMLYGVRERASIYQKWKAKHEWSNAALVLVDPKGLSEDDLDSLEAREPARSGPIVVHQKVPLEYVKNCLPEGEYDRLYKNGTADLLMIGAMSFPGEGRKKYEATDEKTGLHSEELALKAVETLRSEHPEASLKQLTWGSERYYCEECRELVDPDARRYHAFDFALTEAEIAQWKQELKQAQTLPASQRAAAKKSINHKYKTRSELRSKAAGPSLKQAMKKAGENYAEEREVLRSYRNETSDIMTTAPSSPCPTPATGTVNQAAFSTARTALAVPDCDESERHASGLTRALADPGAAPGGIDFSTLELRYLSDPGNGLRYAFGADTGGIDAARRSSTGVRTAREASDSFFVWLALPASTFWVNLNPNEPDRIVDAELGRTDAGRILLQADLRLKKTTARLIHPNTSPGQRFWDRISGQCMSFRTWIVPGPAEVSTKGDELYILDAPLSVKMESQYLAARGNDDAGAASCGKQSKATQARNEKVFRDLILPGIEKAVNEGPEYAELRRVYLSRVAAEWYRERAASSPTAYSDLIDRGDVDDWVTGTRWKPEDTFKQYVRSYRDGEFKVTRRTRNGDYIETRTYIFGGVDFGRVQFERVSDEKAFTGRWSGMPQDTSMAAESVVTGAGESRVWMGADNTPRGAAPDSSRPGGTQEQNGSGPPGDPRPSSDSAAGESGTPGHLVWLLAGLGGFCAVLLLRSRGRRARRR
ncbi:hypothetical protein [Streptomyces sp. NPDC056464]|uniref:hypothetical protein n=1 Tax=Streptomyces sp. NPDC056464 TaxID=3345828 RepID=UPI00367ED43F